MNLINKIKSFFKIPRTSSEISDEVKIALEKAIHEKDAGRFVEALDILDEIIRDDPDIPAAGIYQSEVDLVILDMRMPHNGATTFYEMKQIDAEIKVLIASGYSEDYRIRQLLAQGCNGFLQKPFTLNVLSQKIRTTLNN